uniref:Uncharacterized protein n=1 Tax=Cajanus cajan TaxID=3821 RepID=A0A151RR61_CAJCA|nr:hypothetical protein KK1_033460 [Cajanus cajan]
MKRSQFEFPTTADSGAVPNDVVFCGKLITRQTEPGPHDGSENRVLVRSETCGRTKPQLRSASGGESRWRRPYNGMFGAAKFPLQMELSDIKMRQERREPASLPRVPVEDGGDGGESCWELIRPLRRRGMLRNAFFQCFPIV